MSETIPAAVTARPAKGDDLDDIQRLYSLLEEEMAALRPTWPLADGLPAPTDAALAGLLESAEWEVVVGQLDDVIVGFLAWRDEAMLPQAMGDRLGSVRFIFTEAQARAVGVGEAMMSVFFAEARSRGIQRFDAHVSPGHREAKNFFESNGFKARSIVMHLVDESS